MAYVLGSKVLEKVAGVPWTTFCKDRIFSPLGMKRTLTSHDLFLKDSNAASAHFHPSYSQAPTVSGNGDSEVAAAGIISCAKDMSLWLQYCLSNPPSIQTCQKPQALFEVEGFLDPISCPLWSIYAHDQKIVNYGYGWMIYTLNGTVVLFHPGLGNGMQSIIAVVPEKKLGIVILVNQAPQLGAACLLNTLLDRFLHLPEIPWYTRAISIISPIEKDIKSEKAEIQAKKDTTKPAPALHKYEGHYNHPAYGSIDVGLHAGRLELELFSHEKGTLDYVCGNTFELLDIPSAPRGPWLIEFEPSQDPDHVKALKMPDLGTFKRVEP
jgi:CubicO group peptidase (beta-lactamase class C family)